LRFINIHSLTQLPSVAIVILNWNGRHFLEKFLPSVMASAYEHLSVIVADNASTDDSISFLKKNYPSVSIIINPVNEGFAKGYNTALKQVKADYYVLSNSDVQVSKEWINPIISLMESDKTIAACQPKILSFNHQYQFEYAGASGGWIDKLGYPFSRGRVFDHCETDNGQYEDVSQIFWATGAALFIRSSVFHDMEGFDEFFFAHQEEIDLCWRMQRAGYKIYAVPSSVVYHVGGGTLAMGSKRKVYLNFRNNLIMLSKNLSFSESIWKIPLRLLLDNITACKALIKGDFNAFIAIESAHFNFMKWIFSKRNKKKYPEIKMNQLNGVYNGSVVWQYFINKKKTFYQIIGFKK